MNYYKFKGQFLLSILAASLSLSLTGCLAMGLSANHDDSLGELSSPSELSIPPSAGLAEVGYLDYQMPSTVNLCGESLDFSRRSVYERFEFEFLRVVNQPAQVALWQRRAAMYFPVIEAELKAAGLPDDLKYLAVAESDLRPWIASPAGALGLWQFMPGTARHFGLTVNQQIDHRQLPENILVAAKSYLKSLHGKFGSWSLALAAYNAGDGRIAKALAAQGSQNYYELDLPRETERYVYRIAAIKAVMENAALYRVGENVPQNRYTPPQFAEKKVAVADGCTWPQLAKQVGCDYKELRMLNPHLLVSAPPTGDLVLRVPTEH